MKHVFRIGTRNSRLARRQTELIIDALRSRRADITYDVVPIVTQGDRDLASSLQTIGGKGVFVKEIERELLDGTIDFAAHSLKDVQPVLPDGLTIGCVPKRDSPFDCLISPVEYATLTDLPQDARIGTNSLRRQAQLLRLRPDIDIVPIRGNIETRIRKIETEHLDGVILAEAGLNRLQPDLGGLHRLSLRSTILPATGQGAMAVECRTDDDETLALLSTIDDADTHAAVHIERDFMTALGGSCTFPIGAYARPNATQMAFDGLVASADGRHCFTRHIDGSADDALGRQTAQSLIAEGALEWIR